MAPPHIALPLTAEPSKSRLCHDVRYQNLWIRGSPFSQDTLNDLPRCLAWNNQGGRSCQLNNALEVLFSTTVTLNVVLHLLYVRSAGNLAHGPSRHRSSTDFCLRDRFQGFKVFICHDYI